MGSRNASSRTPHQGDHRVTTDTALMDTCNRLEDMVAGQGHAFLYLQLVGEHVEKEFGIGIRIDVTTVVLEHLPAQGVGIDQVAVVRQCYAIRRIHIKGLRLVAALRARGRIAAMADADDSPQSEHVFTLEHILDQPVAFVQAQARAVDGRDAGRVLTAMLKHGQRVVKRRSDFGLADDSNDSTHDSVHCEEDGGCCCAAGVACLIRCSTATGTVAFSGSR